MEKIFINWFGSLALFIIPVLAGLVTSFIIEAIDYITPTKLSAKWITLAVAILTGVGLIFGFPNVAVELFDKILIVVINIVFAIIFYSIGGKVVVKFLAEKTVGLIKKKAGNE